MRVDVTEKKVGKTRKCKRTTDSLRERRDVHDADKRKRDGFIAERSLLLLELIVMLIILEIVEGSCGLYL